MTRNIQPKLAAVIAKLQKLNSDAVGFGEHVRVQHQGFWKKIDWKKVYPKVKFTIKTRVTIQMDGVLR